MVRLVLSATPNAMADAPTVTIGSPTSRPLPASTAPTRMNGAPSAMNGAPNSNLAADCGSFAAKTAPTVSTAAAAVKMLAVGAELNIAMPAAHPASKRESGGAYRATHARESSPRIQTAAVTTPESATAPASPRCPGLPG
jgi:hypothetical protein